MHRGKKAPKTRNSEAIKASMGPILLSSFINYILVLIGWIVLYFGVCLPSCTGFGSYVSARDYLADQMAAYNLNLPSNLDSDNYESAVDDFFFVQFPEEIKEKFIEGQGLDMTLNHYYNVRVLGLPEDPNPNDYQTSYFSYKTEKADDGTLVILVDEIGVVRDDLNERGLNDVRDLYLNAYRQLESMLSYIDPAFAESSALLDEAGLWSSFASFTLSYVAFVLVLPLCLQGHATLGQLFLKLEVSDVSGYKAKWWRFVVKAVVGYPLLALGASLMNAYSIVLLVIFPYFLDLAYCIFFHRRVPFLEMVAGLDVLDAKESVVYDSELDMEIAQQNQLASYTDAEYVSRLSAAEAMDINDRNERPKS